MDTINESVRYGVGGYHTCFSCMCPGFESPYRNYCFFFKKKKRDYARNFFLTFSKKKEKLSPSRDASTFLALRPRYRRRTSGPRHNQFSNERRAHDANTSRFRSRVRSNIEIALLSYVVSRRFRDFVSFALSRSRPQKNRGKKKRAILHAILPCI